MAAVQLEDDEPIASINITPFVDVVLVLLIILMVTSTHIVRASFQVQLPKAASGGEVVASTANIIPSDPISPKPKKDKPTPQAGPAPSAPPTPTKKPVRRIVGITLESTTQRGTGPAFAVGNTRAGRTEGRAQAPEQVPPSSPPASRYNRIVQPGEGGTLIKPKRLKNMTPKYPETYRVQGVEADVVVRVNIDETGKVTAVAIVSPAPEKAFNQSAKAAAFSEQFEPARRNGRAIAYAITFAYRFRLNN